jgi:hypothetical protein
MIKAFPKIFAIGTDYIADIFKEEVEVTEKVDGSQFAFGKIDGALYMRSKGASLYQENPEKMFIEAIEYISSIDHLIPEGMCFYAEYMKRPKHNTIKYDQIPKNHLSLFAAIDIAKQSFVPDIDKYASLFCIDRIPVIFTGMIESLDFFKEVIKAKSYLGDVDIEGVVVKNYHRKFLLGGQPMPLMSGKYVSEKFKEVHRGRWGKEENKKSRLEMFFQSFRTEARWEKAVQHLRDTGKLEWQPRDIGTLIKHVHSDIAEEEKDAVKEFLWKEFSGQLNRTATVGLPQWYKDKLAENSFDNAK